MDEVTVVIQSDPAEPEGTSDVSRRVASEAGDGLVIQSLVGGGVTTGRHHDGERHVYGYVVNGHAVIEDGPGGTESVALDAGDFISVPPRTIRRVVNSTDEDWEVVIIFVGSGPPAVAVDGPEPVDH